VINQCMINEIHFGFRQWRMITKIMMNIFMKNAINDYLIKKTANFGVFGCFSLNAMYIIDQFSW
jgi:hypothetical protein